MLHIIWIYYSKIKLLIILLSSRLMQIVIDSPYCKLRMLFNSTRSILGSKSFNSFSFYTIIKMMKNLFCLVNFVLKMKRQTLIVSFNWFEINSIKSLWFMLSNSATLKFLLLLVCWLSSIIWLWFCSLSLLIFELDSW